MQHGFEAQKSLRNRYEIKNKGRRFHYKISTFVYLYEFNRDVCLYHSLFMKKIFLSKKEFKDLIEFLKNNKKEETKTIKELYEEGFLIKSRNEDAKLYKKAKSVVTDWSLKTLFIVVTDVCNFKCRYCFQNLTKYSKNKLLDDETIKRAIKTFAEETRNSNVPLSIFFYGGEPLVNYKVIRPVIEYIQQLKDKKILRQPCRIDIITNGSLITEEIAKDALRYNITFGVSLDGFEHNHNSMRIYRNDMGTYKDVTRGIDILRKNGIDFSILCTVGPHNIDEIDKICEFFITELGCKNMNLTLPLCKIGKGPAFSKQIPMDYMLQQIIKTFKVVRKHGAFEGTVFKHLTSFIQEQIFRGECDGMGSQVVIAPNGKIGPCLAFINEKGFFMDSDMSSFDIKNIPVFRKFVRGVAMNTPACKTCPALGVCGGGCMYNRFVKNGTLKKPDTYYCKFIKGLLEWAIGELYKNYTSAP